MNLCALQPLAVAGLLRIVKDEQAVLGVAGVVGASVVLGNVEFVAADGAYGAPGEVTEVDDEVRGQTPPDDPWRGLPCPPDNVVGSTFIYLIWK